MELAIIKLMQKLEVIPEEVGKLMEQSASQRDQNPQQIPGMMPGLQQQQPGMIPPPGMMPGNNPMDMLQMQQMQQMHQMQQMFGQMQQPPK